MDRCVHKRLIGGTAARVGRAKGSFVAHETVVRLEQGIDDRLTKRLSRLALQETGAGPGLTAVMNRLIDATWKAPRATGMQALIQQQTEQLLLTYMLSSIADEKSSFAARSAVVSATTGLKTYIETRLKSVAADGPYAGHLRLALERMKNPEKAKPTQHATAPPGAPIGCE